MTANDCNLALSVKTSKYLGYYKTRRSLCNPSYPSKPHSRGIDVALRLNWGTAQLALRTVTWHYSCVVCQSSFCRATQAVWDHHTAAACESSCIVRAESRPGKKLIGVMEFALDLFLVEKFRSLVEKGDWAGKGRNCQGKEYRSEKLHGVKAMTGSLFEW